LIQRFRDYQSLVAVILFSMARLRELMRKLRVSRARRRALNEQIERQRFEDRQARHKAGIYDQPRGGGL
jgi:hypothetical protein